MAHTFRPLYKFSPSVAKKNLLPPTALLVSLILSAMGWYGFRPDPSHRLPRLSFYSVFGIDQREEIALDNTALQAIGRIELQPEGVIPWLSTAGVSICTGTLVSADLVLTNAHCLMDRETGQLTKKVIWFRPAFGKDSALTAAKGIKVWLGSLNPSRNRSQDWALMRLDQPLGETYSWLELAPLWEDQPFTARSTSLVAYATDFKDGNVAVMHRDCLITRFDPKGSYFRHDCDMNAGSSGGPLLVFSQAKPRILAVNAAHIEPKALSYLPSFSQGLANIAIGSTRFADVLEALRQDHPLPSSPATHLVDLGGSASPPTQATGAVKVVPVH